MRLRVAVYNGCLVEDTLYFECVRACVSSEQYVLFGVYRDKSSSPRKSIFISIYDKLGTANIETWFSETKFRDVL